VDDGKDDVVPLALHAERRAANATNGTRAANLYINKLLRRFDFVGRHYPAEL
jgi:hypothetical protein